jgi:hypothetical protein
MNSEVYTDVAMFLNGYCHQILHALVPQRGLFNVSHDEDTDTWCVQYTAALHKRPGDLLKILCAPYIDQSTVFFTDPSLPAIMFGTGAREMSRRDNLRRVIVELGVHQAHANVISLSISNGLEDRGFTKKHARSRSQCVLTRASFGHVIKVVQEAMMHGETSDVHSATAAEILGRAPRLPCALVADALPTITE